jgi:hypothetical protein
VNRREVRSHHRPFDSLPVPDAGGTPVSDLPFPRMRASAVGASNIARRMAENDRLPQWARDEAVKLVLLMSDVPYDVDAVQSLVECYERDMRELVGEAMERERHISQLERMHALNADASQSAPMQIPVTREPHRAASGE